MRFSNLSHCTNLTHSFSWALAEMCLDFHSRIFTFLLPVVSAIKPFSSSFLVSTIKQAAYLYFAQWFQNVLHNNFFQNLKLSSYYNNNSNLNILKLIVKYARLILDHFTSDWLVPDWIAVTGLPLTGLPLTGFTYNICSWYRTSHNIISNCLMLVKQTILLCMALHNTATHFRLLRHWAKATDFW